MSQTEVAAPRRVSPRKRARRFQIINYCVIAIVIVLAIAFADGRQIQQVFFRPDMIALTIGPELLRVAANTIIYTLGAFVIGLILGTVLGLMRLSNVPPYRWISTAYIEFFRGLPAIVVFLAFGLLPVAFRGLKFPFDPYGTVWIALGLVAAAYMAETIRAGIQAVPKGQTEAARSMGMSPTAATRKIILPQAFRIVLPPLTNELIMLIKDSSLVYVIGLTVSGYELTKYGRDLSSQNSNLTPLVIAGFCYLLITLPLSVVVRRMEASQPKAGR